MDCKSITSLPFCLVKHIYSFIPLHNRLVLSKTHFNIYIHDYYIHYKNMPRGRFYYGKINNTYVRYLIRHDISMFLNHLIYSRQNTPWHKIKRYAYKNTIFKTYVDYCVFLANEYSSQKTKTLLLEYQKKHK